MPRKQLVELPHPVLDPTQLLRRLLHHPLRLPNLHLLHRHRILERRHPRRHQLRLRLLQGPHPSLQSPFPVIPLVRLHPHPRTLHFLRHLANRRRRLRQKHNQPRPEFPERFHRSYFSLAAHLIQRWSRYSSIRCAFRSRYGVCFSAVSTNFFSTFIVEMNSSANFSAS